MRIVFDTNVLLAGMFTPGICEALLDICLTSDQHVGVTSKHILEEFSRHAEKFGAPGSEVRLTVKVLRSQLEMVEPSSVEPGACRDPDDLPVLGTLLASKADCLVTGDQDLLTLKEFHGMPILSPRDLYDRLR